MAIGAKVLLAVFFVALPVLASAWAYRISPYTSDFALYYRDARVGWQYGWSHMYALAGSTAVTQQLGIHNHDPNVPSLSLPLLTWLVAPFALLPFSIAYFAWLAVLVGVTLIAWALAAPHAPVAKGWHLLLAAIFLPLVFGLTLGSAVVLVAFALAVVWWLLRRDQPIVAGLVLCALIIRPQVGILIPLCLLASGRRRLFVSFLAGCVAFVLSVLAVVPIAELEAYAARLGSAAQQPKSWDVASELSVATVRPLWLAAIMIAAVVAIAIATSFVASRTEHRDVVALTAGILGSLLIAPYIHIQDLALLLLVVWFWIPRVPARYWPAVVLPLLFTVNLEMSVHSSLPATLLLLGLLLLGITVFRGRREKAESHATV